MRDKELKLEELLMTSDDQTTYGKQKPLGVDPDQDTKPTQVGLNL
jgi:hypothetical protein